MSDSNYIRKIFGKASSAYRNLSPDATVIFWMAVWWIINLLQSAFTELAHDEAYYHIFAQNIDWAYYDHPPMIALLIKAGELIFGSSELGVRFFVTVLQPLYLYILWKLIPGRDKMTRKDGELFAMISASTVILQLYGFVAVPDAPLLFTSAVFLLTFKWFTEGRKYAWIAMGLAMTAMAYSKYHGALVVIFTMLSALVYAPAVFRRPTLYLSGAITALLILPHLMWEYNHDWASFLYHTSDRNADFRFSYLTEYLLNIAVVFNPFFVPLYIQAWRKTKAADTIGKVLGFLPPAFIVFFMFSALRGHVQPQWIIVSVFGLIYVLFNYVRVHPKTRRYTVMICRITIILVILVRIEMIFNPIGIRFEIFNNKKSFTEIAEKTDNIPVIFNGSYAIASKYIFYTGNRAYCQPQIYYRTHQWQYRNDDMDFTGKPVAIECNKSLISKERTDTITPVLKEITLANGTTFTYFTDNDFHPVRKVEITFPELPEEVNAGETLDIPLEIHNPYPYDITLDGDYSILTMIWRTSLYRTDTFDLLPDRSHDSAASSPANHQNNHQKTSAEKTSACKQDTSDRKQDTSDRKQETSNRKQNISDFLATYPITVPAGSTASTKIRFTVPESLSDGKYYVGFAINRTGYSFWFNGKSKHVKVK